MIICVHRKGDLARDRNGPNEELPVTGNLKRASDICSLLLPQMVPACSLMPEMHFNG